MALGSESATAWPAAADFEELTTTAAPAADSDLATAAPIPLAEPVTIATLPCRLIRLSRRGRLAHRAARGSARSPWPCPGRRCRKMYLPRMTGLSRGKTTGPGGRHARPQERQVPVRSRA